MLAPVYGLRCSKTKLQTQSCRLRQLTTNLNLTLTPQTFSLFIAVLIFFRPPHDPHFASVSFIPSFSQSLSLPFVLSPPPPFTSLIPVPSPLLTGGSVAEWLACWTQAQQGLGTNRSRDAVR